MLSNKIKFLQYNNRNLSINSKKIKKMRFFLQLMAQNNLEIHIHQKLYQEALLKLLQVKI